MRHAQWFASRFRHAFGPKSGPIGIEFRDGQVRMVQVARDRRAHVLESACVVCDRDDPAGSMEQVVHALRGGTFRGRDCVVVLPFAAARAQTLTVPEGSDEAIRADVARTLSQDASWERPEFGFLRLGPIGHARCEVAAVIAERATIEAIVHPLIDAGFWPGAVEPSFVAVARACSRTHRRAADRGRVRLAMDLHREGATALLLQGQTIVYASTVSRRDHAAKALCACSDEANRLFATEPPTEVRLAGTDAYDAELVSTIERGCGLPVHHDDEVGTFADAFGEVGIHATDAGGAAAWVGAFGAAFRGLSRAALRAHHESERDRAGDGAGREAA